MMPYRERFTAEIGVRDSTHQSYLRFLGLITFTSQTHVVAECHAALNGKVNGDMKVHFLTSPGR